VGVLGVASGDDVEVKGNQTPANWAHPAVSDDAVVQLDDGGDVRGRACHEALVRRVEFAPVNVALDYLETELLTHKRHHGIARDADENVGGRWWRDHLIALYHEDVLTGTFRDIDALVKHDRLVEDVEVRLGLVQGRVGVNPRDLRRGRYAGVLHAPPR